MKIGVIIAIAVGFLVVFFLALLYSRYSGQIVIENAEDCNFKNDCMVVNQNCGGCICDVISVNKEFEMSVCANSTEIKLCNLECEPVPVDCIDHKCVLK